VHTKEEREKLTNRVRRIRGQLNAVEKALLENQDCSTVLHSLTACRGAMDSLLYEIIEEHVRFHIVDPGRRPTSQQAKATQELLDALRSYLR
jgi:DNA-binding FrmR family transcriptional regulator